jgi:threonine dehydratase
MAISHGTAITPDQIQSTYARIKSHIRRTPTIEVSGTDFGLKGFALTIKLEHLQHAASFKTRGAFANLLLREVPPAGVVAASGGNHGTAVAYAAMRMGVPARIFVPTISSPAKIERIRSYGADLVVGGERYADALVASQEWAASSGALQVHAYDQIETLLGQGTLGSEMSDQGAALDTLLVPVGGGGLIGGVAAWYAGGIRVIGVEPADAPTLHAALAAERPVDVSVGGIAADSLGARQVGTLMFPIAQRYIERVVLVSDAAIRQAMLALWSVLRIVVEPGAAASIAALVSGGYQPAESERVGVVLSGANTGVVNFGA